MIISCFRVYKWRFVFINEPQEQNRDVISIWERLGEHLGRILHELNFHEINALH